MKTPLFAVMALIAFAGNSVLCRLALGIDLGADLPTGLDARAIDPASFTSIRLGSGALTLFLLLAFSGKLKMGGLKPVSLKSDTANDSVLAAKGSWLAALSLFLYAALFSYAYITLDTATGALILFGSVQITMISVGWLRGNRLSKPEVIGICLAVLGFVYLFLPELRQPSLLGLVVMVFAGVAWGDYTLRGQASSDALSTTAYNFLRTLPLVALLLVVLAIAGMTFNLSQKGVLLAIASGAITSGIGYAIWYQALHGLTTTQAAVIQLLVPVIAAVGGVLFANEAISLRLVLAGLMVLGGVLIVIISRAKTA